MTSFGLEEGKEATFADIAVGERFRFPSVHSSFFRKVLGSKGQHLYVYDHDIKDVWRYWTPDYTRVLTHPQK